MWKEDSQNRALWPHGLSTTIQPSSMRNLEDLKCRLQGFVNHGDQLSKKDSTGEYRKQYKSLSYYWCRVKAALDLPSKFDETLKDGFWPTTRVAPSFEDEFMETSNLHEEYDEDEHFISQAHNRLAESVRVNWDLNEGYFVTVRPFEDDSKHPLWIARALSNPNLNPEHPGCVLIQCFRPV